MKCAHCGEENQKDAKFCSSCGQKLAQAGEGSGCLNCGAPLKASAKFCPSCGQAVGGPAASEVMNATWRDIDVSEGGRRGPRFSRATMLPLLLVPALVAIIFLVTRYTNQPAQTPPAGPSGMAGGAPQMEAVFKQIDSLRAALKANPKDTTALLVLGEMYEIANRIDEASDYYHRFLEINPRNLDVQLRVANILFNKKEYTAAEEHLKQIIQDHPDNPYALYNYALTLHMKGNLDEAVSTWEKVVSLDPDGEIGKQAKQALSTVQQIKQNKM